ncbi:cobalamin-binding protein [Porticoccus sp.]
MAGFRRLCLVLLLGVSASAECRIVVEDDIGETIELAQPAQRVISLAPHLTEVVYSLGAGSQMVATVAWSDFPEEAKSLPVIGSNNKINYEALLSYQPDLVLVWLSGNGEGIISRLKVLGLNVYVNKPRHLEDIPRTLEKLGNLLGRQGAATDVSEAFRQTMTELDQKYGQQRPVEVYYQIWQSPLMTFGGSHLVSDVITLCGGRNVFADTAGLVPRLGVESVLAADPEAIIVGQYTELDNAFQYWRQWPELRAVKAEHLYSVDPYLLHRHTPRIVLGARQLCEAIAKARLE